MRRNYAYSLTNSYKYKRSKSNTSAQLAGSSLNKFMSYVTTVTDVSQAAPESVGNAMKTLYSRFGNVKSGKFVAGAGEEDNAEEFEAFTEKMETIGGLEWTQKGSNETGAAWRTVEIQLYKN